MEFEKQHKPCNKNWQSAELQKKMGGMRQVNAVSLLGHFGTWHVGMPTAPAAKASAMKMLNVAWIGKWGCVCVKVMHLHEVPGIGPDPKMIWTWWNNWQNWVLQPKLDWDLLAFSSTRTRTIIPNLYFPGSFLWFCFTLTFSGDSKSRFNPMLSWMLRLFWSSFNILAFTPIKHDSLLNQDFLFTPGDTIVGLQAVVYVKTWMFWESVGIKSSELNLSEASCSC